MFLANEAVLDLLVPMENVWACANKKVYQLEPGKATSSQSPFEAREISGFKSQVMTQVAET